LLNNSIKSFDILLAAGKIIFNGHPKNAVEEICSQWLVIFLIGFFRFQKPTMILRSIDSL
jgi:hypothetical protein